jgi:hypothetical protein
MDLQQKINLYKNLITDAGRIELSRTIQEWKKQHGAKWLEEFKIDFPPLVGIIDLAANHEAETAFEELKNIIVKEIETEIESNMFRSAARIAIFSFLDVNKPHVFKLHAELKNEIDKPRY